MICIFCDNKVDKPSEEHIVPESLGNEKYILKLNSICAPCNNSFSKFEAEALSKTILGFERARLGVKTKKGKPSTGEVRDVKFTANAEQKKNFVTVHGVTEEHIVGVNPSDNTFQVKVPAFDKNEIPTSKLLLKMGFESIFQSQKKIFSENDYRELKSYLMKRENKDWPFLTSQTSLHPFKSIPTLYDKYCLKRLDCHLNYFSVSKDVLLFQFKYGGAHFITNLLNRNIDWTKEYLSKDKNARVYPAYFTV